MRVSLTILLTGSLAGLVVDRVLIANPALRHVGAIGLASFSRHGDLMSGLFVYSVRAIGGMMLIAASADALCA